MSMMAKSVKRFFETHHAPNEMIVMVRKIRGHA
jgi:hypothetical protein